MLCELRRISSVSDATADSIERFLCNDAEKKTPSPRKSPKRTTLITPPDELQLVDEDEGDNLAESDTGIRDLVAAELTGERSESELPVGGEDWRWMKISLIAASHNFDLMVVAAGQKFVILQRSYTNQKQLESIAQVTLQPVDSADPVYITSILPMCIATNRFSQSSIDWTCVCVGLSDGTIQFYTERGVLVFVEKCANEPINALRFGPSIYSSKQEMTALVGDNRLIAFEGLSLFGVLRHSRNQIASGEKNAHELSNTLLLSCHCIELERAPGGAHDFADVGIMHVDNFDQYVNASCSSAGRDASPTNNSLPIFTSYFCVHRDRFASFQWHDGAVAITEMLGEMATDFVLQMTSVLPSFGIRSMLGIGTSRRDRPAKKCAMDARRYRAVERSSLYDKGRTADRCYMAPIGWNLIAVADSCARVLLIDTVKRCILRIWKGYRNARCAWVESAATEVFVDRRGVRKMNVKSRTLFLVIFAPKRALLEVWSMQNGPRVAQFKVHEKGRLLAVDAAERATLMGNTATNIFHYSYGYTTAVFLFPDGSIFDIRVPFHLSAMDVSVSSVHEENILKSFQINYFLQTDSQKNADGGESIHKLNFERCLTQCLRLNSASSRRRFVDLIGDHVDQALGGKCCGDTGRGEAISGQPSCVPLSDFSLFVNKLHNALTVSRSNGSQNTEEKNTKDSDALAYHIASLHLYLRIADAIRRMNADASNVASINVDYSQLESTLNMSVDELELRIFRPEPPKEPSHCRALTLKAFMEQFVFAVDPKISVFFDYKNLPTHKVAMIRRNLNFVSVGATLFGPFICGSAEPSSFITEILPLLDMQKSTLVEIYADFWLDSSWNIDPQRWFARSIEVMSMLIDFCKSQQEYLDIVDAIEYRVFRSSHTHAALLLCLQLRVARIRRIERMRAANQIISSSPRHPGYGADSDKKANIEDKDNSFTFIDDDDLIYHKYYKDTNFDGVSRSVATASTANEEPAYWTRTELFDLYIEHLKICTLFECLPWGHDGAVISPDIARNKTITLEILAHRREGFYRELVGLWVVAHRLPFKEFGVLWIKFTEEEIKTNHDKYPVLCEELLTGSQLPERTQLIFKRICNYLPNTLSLARVVLDCCWECARAWTRDESRRVMYLQILVQYVAQFGQFDRLKHGLIAQLWSNILVDSFKNLYKIMNEKKASDGQSRDRILKRDVLITESDLSDYVECVRELLRILAETSANLVGANPDTWLMTGCAYDPVINAFFAHSKIRSVALELTDPDPLRLRKQEERKINCRNLKKVATLDDVVRLTKPTNYHLVLHHKHLASVIWLTVSYGINICPETLFDAVGKMALFAPLGSHPFIRITDVDESTRDRRQQFLETVLEYSEANGVFMEQDRYATTWLLINGLAKDWELDVPTLKIKQIAVLYHNGFDDEAQRLTMKVKNRKVLLQYLLPVIAGRIKHFMEDERELYMKFFQWATLNPTWVHQMNQSKSDAFAPKFPYVTPEGLKCMTAHVLLFRLRPGGISHLGPDGISQVILPTEQQIDLIKDFDKAAGVIVRFYKEKMAKASRVTN